MNSVVKLISVRDARGRKHTVDSLVKELNDYVELKCPPYYHTYYFPKGNLKKIYYGWFRRKYKYVLIDDVWREFYEILLSSGYRVEFKENKFFNEVSMKVSW